MKSWCKKLLTAGLIFMTAVAAVKTPMPVYADEVSGNSVQYITDDDRWRASVELKNYKESLIKRENPEQYITSVGKLLRKTSLDELPQIFQIFTGKMSVIGPRPALWNQFDLIAERDKYGANDIRPGLTGWAQINGRDELPIDVKAKLDGEYAQNLSFAFDCRCFFGSITAVLKHKGVVEGGTGAMDKEHQA